MSALEVKEWAPDIRQEEGLTNNRNDMQAELAQRWSGGEQNRRSQEVVAYVSHELRNTLAPIRYALTIMNCRRIEDPILREAPGKSARPFKNEQAIS